VRLLLSALLLSGCCDTGPARDHHDPVSRQGYVHLEEGCAELFDGLSVSEPIGSTCVDDTGYRCTFEVGLPDGSVGCCSESSTTGQAGEDYAFWHSCEGY